MLTTTTTFEGNIATDLELTYTNHTQTPVVEFVVLVNRRTQDDQGEWTDATPTRHRVKAYRSLAEGVSTLVKGQRVIVYGFVQTEEWNDPQTGERRTSDHVLANAIGHSVRFAATAE